MTMHFRGGLLWIYAICFIYLFEMHGVCGDLGSLSRLPVSTHIVERRSGSFSFELLPQGRDTNDFTITIKAIPQSEKGLVSIEDESQALLSFLDSLAAKQVSLSNIKHIYLPSTVEAEVRERIAKYAAASKAWKEHTAQNSTRVLVDMLIKANAYSEIDMILRQHHLRVKNFTVEEIITRKITASDDASKTVKVPVSWTTFIGVEVAK